MRMGEAAKGLRVCLTPEVFARHQDSMVVRTFGTLTSGRILHSQPPYEEGLTVRVKWDGLTTPENWHLADLAAATPGARERGSREHYARAHCPASQQPILASFSGPERGQRRSPALSGARRDPV